MTKRMALCWKCTSGVIISTTYIYCKECKCNVKDFTNPPADCPVRAAWRLDDERKKQNG